MKSKNLDEEWARRTLCRDESCIGVIGADGRCKECGLPYDEGNRTPASPPLPAAPAEDQKKTGRQQPCCSRPQAPETNRDHADAWEHRTLCRDEGCIGVIGADGRCKECGLPYQDPKPS